MANLGEDMWLKHIKSETYCGRTSEYYAVVSSAGVITPAQADRSMESLIGATFY